MRWAITPRGTGHPVGARSIRDDWPLIEGETFVVDQYHDGLVLAEDGMSLREPTPEEIEARAVPRVVSAAQAKVALFNAGLIDAVEHAISEAGYQPLRIYYENATEWHRDHPYILGMAAEVGLTEKQVDDLFRAAAQL